jgi:HSP20 family protein
MTSDSKFDPLKELANLRNNLSRTIQQGIRNVLPNTFPAMDIYEQTDELVIQTESLIGLVTDSLEVSIESNTLTLKGQTTPPSDIPEGAYLHRERVFGAFQRSLALPQPVIATSAKSSLKSGILTIRIPKQKDTSHIVSITPVQE